MYTKTIAILFFAAQISCNKKAAESNQNTNIKAEIAEQVPFETVKNTKIVMSHLQKKSMAATIKLNGKIDVPPQNLVSVSVPMGGYLKSTKLLPGMHINKGEIIATVEDQQYIQLQQDYLLAKAKLNISQQEYNRQNELNLSQASSDKITQQALYEVNNAKITINSIAEKLRILGLNPNALTPETIKGAINIQSKITGFVAKVNVNIGKYVNPTDVLFELIDPNDIHLNMKVFEKDIPKLFIGQQIMAYTNHQPEKKFKCEIILISQDINSDGYVEVHSHFHDYSKNLLPGMYMNADLIVNSNNSYAINDEAIVSFEGKNYVFVQAVNKNFEMLEVELGQKTENFIEIKNYALLIDKNIVIKEAYTLLMALKNKEEE